MVALMIASLLLVLVGVTAAVVDLGTLRNERARAQTAADAGALAGATGELALLRDRSVADLAADFTFRNLGLKVPSRASCGDGCFRYVSDGVTVEVEPGMARPDRAGRYVRVGVCWDLATTFAAAIGVSTTTACGNASAGAAATGAVRGCVVCVLGETGPTLRLTGSSVVSVENGDVAVNSTAPDALSISGTSASVTAFPVTDYVISLSGGYSAPSATQVAPTPLTGQAPVVDPFAAVLPIDWALPHYGSVEAGSSDVYLQPGVYDEIISDSGGTVHLMPGVYVIRNRVRLGGRGTIAKPSIAGSNVLLYFACPSYPVGCAPGEAGAGLTTRGGSYVALSGIEDADSSYAGMVIMSDPNNTGRIELVGNSGLTVTGSVYARSGSVELRGTSDFTATTSVIDFLTMFVAGSIELNGDAQIRLGFDPSKNPPAVAELRLTGLVS